MNITHTPLEGLLVIKPTIYNDERGFFLEIYRQSRYKEAGILEEFVQDNHSHSTKGVLRGLHFQIKQPQAQLVTVIRGHIFDVCVDVRPNSPTFGKWYGVELNHQETCQIYMAPGFAHGFYAFSEEVDLHYKVSRQYEPSDEGGLYWNDPNVGIEWPLDISPIVAPRDANYPMLKDIKF